MKAEDLMIGDWVIYHPNVFIEDPMETFEEPYSIQIESGEDIDLAIEDCYSPILLTKDVIKKNGALWYNELELYVIDGVYLSYDERNNCFDVGNVGIGFYGKVFHYFTTIRYVHELQHLLRLWGSEKEIKL